MLLGRGGGGHRYARGSGFLLLTCGSRERPGKLGGRVGLPVALSPE